MKRYLFLIAWVEGSDSTYEPTSVHNQNDLYDQFMSGNEAVFSVEVFATNDGVADAFGYKAAFFENFTAHDCVSVCMEIDASLKLPEVNESVHQTP